MKCSSKSVPFQVSCADLQDIDLNNVYWQDPQILYVHSVMWCWESSFLHDTGDAGLTLLDSQWSTYSSYLSEEYWYYIP